MAYDFLKKILMEFPLLKQIDLFEIIYSTKIYAMYKNSHIEKFLFEVQCCKFIENIIVLQMKGEESTEGPENVQNHFCLQ